jgi:hypothetical protein
MASISEAFGSTESPKKIADDLFDSVEWDPDLPSASAPDSPEPIEAIIAAPQPLAYTTVGSLVDPNAVPQFTAPHRIQREGAGRRPLMNLMQNRPLMPTRHQEQSYVHPHDPQLSLSMQDSMHYAQQLADSPARLHQAQQPKLSRSSRLAISRQQISLTDDEIEVLKRMAGPRMVSRKKVGSPGSCSQSCRPLTSTVLSEMKKPPGQFSPPRTFTESQDLTLLVMLPSDISEDGQRQSTALSGLEKMQTIQRLAKFENPMQELARSRLSALSVTNHLGRTVANPAGLPASSLAVNETSQPKAPKQGELDHDYQFPPPGFDLVPRAKSLLGEYSASIVQLALANQNSGVPRPLTAGPPGQRQYLTNGISTGIKSTIESRQLKNESKNLSAVYTEHFPGALVDSQKCHSILDQQAFTNAKSQDLRVTSQIPAPVQQPRASAFEGDIFGSKLVDSLPISAITKYYHGLPSDMTGNWTPLSYQTKVKMGQISGVQEPATAVEEELALRMQMDDWFYSGQQEYGKTINDHINDMERREEVRRTSGFGHIRLPPKKIIEKMPITEQEMKDMTSAEATEPLVDALFGTLLGYADETSDSESRRHLSGFVKAPDFLIDSSEKGNMSFFGEDWGAPPKSAGGRHSYHTASHGTSTTLWD